MQQIIHLTIIFPEAPEILSETIPYKGIQPNPARLTVFQSEFQMFGWTSINPMTYYKSANAAEWDNDQEAIQEVETMIEVANLASGLAPNQYSFFRGNPIENSAAIITNTIT